MNFIRKSSAFTSPYQGPGTQEQTIPLFKVFMAESVQAAVTRVLYSGYIGEGEEVVSFERELAARLGLTRVVTVNSGTSALHLACHMSVNGAADAEIITTPMTNMATNTSIVQNGARIVWADIGPAASTANKAMRTMDFVMS